MAPIATIGVDLVLDVRQHRGVREHEACHRSLIAARLQREWGFGVEHLRVPVKVVASRDDRPPPMG